MKTMKRILSLALIATMTLCVFAGCGGNDSGGTTTVSFMYGGDVVLSEMYNTVISVFNETAGKEAGVRVKGIPKSGSLDSVLAQQLPSNSGPDVVAISDEYFKKYTKYLEDMMGKIDQAVLDDFYANTVSRFHYDIENTTSNADDPLYGLPGYNDATVLYYNKTVLEKVGVICISVDEKDLDAFNAGTGKDLNGKTKADYGITSDLPAKGFFRSIAPYVPAEGETDGNSWTAPISGEELVFNDRIAMNWDEIEDLGMICTKEKNAGSPSQYGYYTEWWFNYGWSVGGDCLEDLSGEGAWTYSLAGNNPNYIVGEGKSYTGVYTGTVYNAGDTLDVKDIVNAVAGDTISYTATIKKTMRDEWGMAPLPQYKTYSDPSDPSCDEVEKLGKMASHSLGYSISISAKSEVKDAAYVFVKWLATEGQKVLAENGYLSSRQSDASLVLEKLPYPNAQIVLDSLASSSAGDWWYMPDRAWINTWATPLNNQVRYGKMELDEFLYGYIEETNQRLQEYKQ